MGVSAQISKRLLIAALLALLGACAVQPVEELPLDQKVVQLQKEFKFGAAKRAIENAPEGEEWSAKARQELLQNNRKASSAYEQAVISEASSLQKEQAWASANELYQGALQAYPESHTLREALNNFYISRDDFHREQLLSYRILRAKRLPEELNKLKMIGESGDPEQYQLGLAEASDIAEALLAEGQRLMAGKKWRSARSMLQLSKNLRDDERTNTALRVVKTRVKPTRVAKKPKPLLEEVVPEAQLKVDETAIAAAMHRYRYSVQQKNLVNAKRHLDEAIILKPGDSKLEREQSRLAALIQTDVGQRIEQGKYQYSLGDIDKAIEHWEYAYALSPEDEALRERLQKAHRFRNRYEQLKR
ncbi:MAG: hypothetical protein AAF542_10320 [Pseudomonadota bacterium]